jgi:mannose-6-phosphate isomerase-like protein (cupin superfamily)
VLEINSGEILEVPPGVKHVVRDTLTPFEGFTFRVPGLNDKIEF